MNYWTQTPGTKLAEALEQLPKAELLDLVAYGTNEDGTAKNPTRITDKAVFCKGTHVGTVSRFYKLVQHKDAMTPIIQCIKGEDFTFTLFANKNRAELGVLIGEAGTEQDRVNFGFKANNSVDGSSAIRYGFRAGRIQKWLEIVEKEKVTVWTVRQVCSNGATIRIPLKSEKYLDVETRQRFTELMSKAMSITHKGNVESRLAEVQYVVEAFLLLRNPLNRIIAEAKDQKLTDVETQELLKKYVGKRNVSAINDSLNDSADHTLWGLFNAITFVASHGGLKDGTRQGLTDRAANLLEGELMQVTP